MIVTEVGIDTEVGVGTELKVVCVGSGSGGGGGGGGGGPPTGPEQIFPMVQHPIMSLLPLKQ